MTETNLIEDLRLLSPPDYRWLLVALLSMMAVCGIVLLARRMRRSSITGTPDAQDPAWWDLALAELEQLQHLLAREYSREYGIRSTGILRRYIETRYSLHAPLLATEEFLAEGVRSSALPAEHRARLARFLELCDLFKFGRYLASAEELRELHAAAIAFVVASRPPEPKPLDGVKGKG